MARDNRIPLITNEGNNVGGIDEAHGLRKRARDSGVTVFTPGDYVATPGVPFPAASQAFARRFKERQAEFLSKREHDDHDAVSEHLDMIGRVYQSCFQAMGTRVAAVTT